MKRHVTMFFTMLSPWLGAAVQAQSSPAPATVGAVQPMSAALAAFAKQSGLQLIYVSREVSAVISHGAPPGLPVRDTLMRLLADTGLAFEFLNERTVRIFPIDPRIQAASKSKSLTDAAAPPGGDTSGESGPGDRPQPTNDKTGDRAMTRGILERVAGVFAICGAAMHGGAACAAAPAEDSSDIPEIVVTAERRSDTIHNIAASIDAVTPQQIENQNLFTAQDIARVVPALRVGSTNNALGQVDVAIRGIRSLTGAATTGIYVDDVSITERTELPQPGGSVLPELFDLERVEVLYGPQGTLYGGSSEGGTIRFITPQPSFTSYSGKARLEGTLTEDGSSGHDLGAAFGGPIIEDTLAFRVSADQRLDGGYVDHVSQFTGATLAHDTNWSETTGAHASLALKPFDDATITLSYLYAKTYYNDTDSYWENFPTFTGPVSGAAHNYGPFDFYGAYKTGLNTNIGADSYASDSQLTALTSPNSHTMNLPALTLDYAFGSLSFKSISAFNDTVNKVATNTSFADLVGVVTAGLPYADGSPFVANLPLYAGIQSQDGIFRAFSQEFRLSSNSADAPLSWVSGAYYSDSNLNSTAVLTANLGDAIYAATVPAAVPFSATPLAAFNGAILNAPNHTNEKVLALFGEGTYSFTPNLKGTVGLRVTRDELSIVTKQGGALFFPATPNLLAPTADETFSQTPVTPKFGLQYILDANTNFYADAAKGYRPGGVDANLQSSTTCAAALENTFGSVANQPLLFKSDSLWSYEAGIKTRPWDGRATINASVFYINWKDPQIEFILGFGCSQPDTISANADIISKGAQLDANVRLFSAFSANFNAGYTDATFNGTVNTGPGTPAIFNRGNEVPFTPKVTFSVGGQYDFAVLSQKAFVRIDDQYQGSMILSSGPGTANYQVDDFSLPGSQSINGRAGLSVGNLDLALFVNNLTDSKDLLNRSGLGLTNAPGRPCANSTCTSYGNPLIGVADTSLRPRTLGLSVAYKYK